MTHIDACALCLATCCWSRVLSSRCRRHILNPLPLHVRSLRNSSCTSSRALVADILKWRSLPLDTSSTICKRGWLVCTTVRTRTHGIVGRTRHAYPPVHVLMGIDKVGRATHTRASRTRCGGLSCWRRGRRCTDLFSLDRRAALRVNARSSFIFWYGRFGVWVEGGKVVDGCIAVSMLLQTFSGSRRNETNGWSIVWRWSNR